jgi:hypothetical protein
VVVWLMAAVGLTAASGIAKERQKQTLIDLLMLPNPRSALLKAKLYGALLRGVWPGVLLAVLLLPPLFNGSLAVLGYVLLLLLAAALTLLAAGLGLWLSARCRTPLHATAAWLGLVGVTMLGTFLLAEANIERVHRGSQNKMDYPLWSRMVNPVIAWGQLSMRRSPAGEGYVTGPTGQPWPTTSAELRAAGLCSLLNGLLGVGLVGIALRRFEREGRA